MRDIFHNLAVVSAIPPATYAADTTPADIDLAGFEAAMLTLHVGVGGITFDPTNKIEFVMTHSDDGVTYIPVTDDDIQGPTGTTGGIVLALTAAQASPTVTKVGYIGDKQHLKVLAAFSGTHGTGTPIAATVTKGHAKDRPVAA